MVRADKNYGQHFLINEGVVHKIVDAVARQATKLTNNDVVEIGPGPGILTAALLAKGLRVLAVELDHRMVSELNRRFSAAIESGNLVVLPADATSLTSVALQSATPDFKLSQPFAMCGNLPYNVGTVIVFNALENLPFAETFSFMLQKEVVQRFKSENKSKSYGIPSIKFSWTVDFLDTFWVSPGSFNPPPKVESGVMTYRRKAKSELVCDPCERQGLYDRVSGLVNRLFQNRRKMMGSTVRELKTHPLGQKRPEELEGHDFIELARFLDRESPRDIG